MGSMMKLELNQLTLGYKGHLPLANTLDQSLCGPGLHLLVGRNGTGKSTLLRTVLGLIPALGGTVSWDGKPLENMSPQQRARTAAFVASMPPRATPLTVGAILELMPAEVDECRSVLAEYGEETWWDVPLAQLSDGQAARVMLARAVLQSTPWIAMDEPTAFLDAPSRSALVSQLGALESKAVVLASHDLHLLAGHPALTSVHLLHSDGLTALDPTASASSWECQISDS
jgi:iron complex transport system ATP-binding protein